MVRDTRNGRHRNAPSADMERCLIRSGGGSMMEVRETAVFASVSVEVRAASVSTKWSTGKTVWVLESF